MGHIAFRRDVMSIRAYVKFITRFKFTSKFRCKFTSAFLLQLIIPSGLESETMYDTYLHQDLLMYGTVAPGSCPWAGLGFGAGASVYCGYISSCCFFFVCVLLAHLSRRLMVSYCDHSPSVVGGGVVVIVVVRMSVCPQSLNNISS